MHLCQPSQLNAVSISIPGLSVGKHVFKNFQISLSDFLSVGCCIFSNILDCIHKPCCTWSASGISRRFSKFVECLFSRCISESHQIVKDMSVKRQTQKLRKYSLLALSFSEAKENEVNTCKEAIHIMLHSI